MAVWGAAVLIGLQRVAMSSPGAAKLYIFAVVLSWIACTMYIVHRGWQEEGLIGALFSWRYPLGGLWEDVSGRRLAAMWLLVVATVCSAGLAFRHPEIAESLPIGRRPTRAVHDVLLPAGN